MRASARQDLSLAHDSAATARRAFDLFGANNVMRPRVRGAEWWLRMRDWLIASR